MEGVGARLRKGYSLPSPSRLSSTPDGGPDPTPFTTLTLSRWRVSDSRVRDTIAIIPLVRTSVLYPIHWNPPGEGFNVPKDLRHSDGRLRGPSPTYSPVSPRKGRLTQGFFVSSGQSLTAQSTFWVSLLTCRFLVSPFYNCLLRFECLILLLRLDDWSFFS